MSWRAVQAGVQLCTQLSVVQSAVQVHSQSSNCTVSCTVSYLTKSQPPPHSECEGQGSHGIDEQLVVLMYSKS